jgi:hypothetical protein
MTYVITPTIDDKHYARIRYPFWYRSLRNYAQTLCRGLDETGALCMVARPSDWDTHPDNVTPTVSAVPATPAIARIAASAGVLARAAVAASTGSPAQPARIRVRPTMVRPPSAVVTNATTGVVPNFN